MLPVPIHSASPPTSRRISGKRRTKNLVMTGLMALAVVVVGFVLILVLATVGAKGWSIVSGSVPRLVHQRHPIGATPTGPRHEGRGRRHVSSSLSPRR